MRQIYLTEEHHRRPRFVGGDDSQSNISYVEPHKHKPWHVLFGSLNAFQIADRFNTLEFKPEGIKVICEFINGSPVLKKGNKGSSNKNKIDSAWEKLFGKDKSFKEAIAYTNNVWLDPSYHLRIVPDE
ncbi:hypothetical protein A3C57_02650 [Candidatus Nomurabacteria bacterium RIFCSPHIGHO2_02_FULL_33_12]|uniref:Uncharacterized protein n=1 Tax=Candidatus Nomurabacteria bacterium RIFCSPLOWO2_01_FULL_33_17 TaxID=1801764 RepID=A0A1F6WNV0_9BACT|nr:MAG: hypothetical protein A3C57_02650 [Candidatus Nomurabacteria bacterium RIFCSPHIGHO2_02_FULL_33_12]OGI83582.1 MAG: hypothetical protein A2903_02590 [Candidatus Nomurabacteria bacterium RIFCSPLOWO2_01_FULL_33_17]